jgi:excisionase family DNA binding protein
MTDGDGHLLTPAELAEVLRLPVASVWRLAREGCLPHFRAGRRLYRFDLAAVLAALEKAAQDEREGR